MIPLGSPSLTPTPLSILSADFTQAFGRPAGLWLPCGGPEAKAYDLSRGELGGGNHGTLNGGVTTSADSWGVLGRSWKLDGSTGYVSMSPPVTTYPFTVAAVFSLAAAPGSDGDQIFSLGTTTALGHLFAIGVSSSSKFTAFVRTGSTASVSCSPTIVQGSMYFGCAVFQSSSSVIAYLNAANASALNPGFTPAGIVNAQIGRNPSTWTSFIDWWNGLVPFVGVWPTALTAAQVSSLYASLQTGEPYRLFQSRGLTRFVGASAASGGPWPWFFDSQMSGGLQSLGGF